jgi:hypothetical protein
MKKQKKEKATKVPTLLMPGFDYGLENRIALLTAPDFNNNLRAANVIACAYGFKHSDEINAPVPIISLVATRADLLKEAFLQFKSWIDATGPDAIRVEILYSEEGYYISFGPDAKHLSWRTIGLDQTVDPLIWTLTYIKTIDTRNPFIDQLADNARLPVAPVIVAGAEYTGSERLGHVPSPHDMRPIPGCPELFLLQLPVYKTTVEVPRESGLMARTDVSSKETLASARESYDQQATTPEKVFRHRERCIASLMPMTLHMLRRFKPLRAKIYALAEVTEFQPWQLEQAVVNQRIWSLIAPAAQSRMQKPKELFGEISSLIELDRPNWLGLASDHEAIIKQAQRDLRVLLKGLGLPRPQDITECQRQLEKNGYLRLEAGT